MNCYKGYCKYYCTNKTCSLDGYDCDYRHDRDLESKLCNGAWIEHCRHENDSTPYDFELRACIHWFSCQNLCRFYVSCDEQ